MRGAFLVFSRFFYLFLSLPIEGMFQHIGRPHAPHAGFTDAVLFR